MRSPSRFLPLRLRSCGVLSGESLFLRLAAGRVLALGLEARGLCFCSLGVSACGFLQSSLSTHRLLALSLQADGFGACCLLSGCLLTSRLQACSLAADGLLMFGFQASGFGTGGLLPEHFLLRGLDTGGFQTLGLLASIAFHPGGVLCVGILRSRGLDFRARGTWRYGRGDHRGRLRGRTRR